MRKITYFTLILMMTLLSSCNDFLNLPPLNKITEDQIFGTEAGIESYMATLYNKLPIEDFNYGSESGFNNWISGCFVPAISCDEAIPVSYTHLDVYKRQEYGELCAWQSTYSTHGLFVQLCRAAVESAILVERSNEQIIHSLS